MVPDIDTGIITTNAPKIFTFVAFVIGVGVLLKLTKRAS